MSNSAAIANAIATQIENLSAPSGHKALSSVTYRLPQAIGATPCALVFPPEEPDWGYYPGGSRTTEQDWTVRLYLAEYGSIARSMDAYYAWRDVIVELAISHIQLGLEAYVSWARVTDISPGWILPYADNTYVGLEVTVRVGVADATSPAA